MTPASVQRDAQVLMGDVTIAIFKATSTLEHLRNILKDGDVGQKNEDVRELKDCFHRILEKSDGFYRNLDRLREAKKGHAFRDEEFLEDKMEQVETIRQALRSLIEFLTPAPSSEDFVGGALDEFLDLMNSLIAAANLIKLDDADLLDIYEGRQPLRQNPASGSQAHTRTP